MDEITTNISWVAIIVGAVLAFIAGWLWYSPILFGKKWAEGSGVELNDASSMPMGAMAAQIIGLIIVAWFVAAMAAQNLLLTTILAVISFTILQWSGNSFSGKSSYAKLVDAGYWLVSVIIMIAVQAVL
ncbi:DUF1761 domain-containing protein [Maritalea sp. S77]|uniref:DUF1761 domain-containing protein n=1 Tax=Maritalea sp. S77 TaxID=3415125 RepID=UPI003C7DCEEE